MRAISIFLFIAMSSIIFSAPTTAKGHINKHRTGSIYFSWGYNTEWYTRSTVHVSQNALGNNYDLVHVQAVDHQGWNTGITNKAITIPQYNYRLGYYFNDKQDMGIEVNFDHTKYLIKDPQNININGTLGGNPVNGHILFTQANGFYYYLNNGANFLLINFMKRFGLYRSPRNNFALDAIGKVGIGPVTPHVQNELFGQTNLPHFQIGGWNTGVETALRATIERYAFIEFSQKLDYARYSHLDVYKGMARQNFATYELILSIGFYIPATKHNPMFARNKHTTEKTDESAPTEENDKDEDNNKKDKKGDKNE